MTVQGRTQAYSAGNKVYGGGRPMPTVGTVSKMGYRERDRQHMVFQNAIQRRLGSTPAVPAPQHLNTIQQVQQYAAQHGQTIGSGTPSPAPVAASPNGQIQSTPQTPQTQGPGHAWNPGSPAGVPQGYIDPGASQNPYGAKLTTGMGMNESGGQSAQADVQTQPSGVAQGNSLNNLPYDPAYTDELRQLDAQKAAHDAGLAQQRGNYELQAGNQKRDLERQRPIDSQNLLENFSGRGMAYSGAYGRDYGNLQDQYSTQEAGVDQNLAQQLAQMAASNAEFGGQDAAARIAAEQNYIRTLAGNAGDLGLSQLPDGYGPGGQMGSANFGLGDTTDQIGDSPVPGMVNPVNVGTTPIHALPQVYSPGQLALERQLGIHHGSMSPTQLHSLGVQMGYKAPAPKPVAAKLPKPPAPKAAPKSAGRPVKSTPLTRTAPRRAR